MLSWFVWDRKVFQGWACEFKSCHVVSAGDQTHHPLFALVWNALPLNKIQFPHVSHPPLFKPVSSPNAVCKNLISLPTSSHLFVVIVLF